MVIISWISMGQKSLTVIIALACLISMLSLRVEGKDIIVGDGKWKLDFNYTAWAENQMLTVGDTLVFNYAKGSHNVQSVSGAAFKNCSTGSDAVSYESGNDMVPLTREGNMWFLCSVGEHCNNGMKFKITVMPATTALTPAEPPQSMAAPSFSSASSAFSALILAYMALFVL